MPFDYEKVVRKAFDHLGPRNPLKKLRDSDKRVLVALLDMYMRTPDEFFNPLEEAADIVAEAGALGRRIQSDVLRGQLTQLLAPFPARLLGSAQDLAARLEDFSQKLGILLDNIAGKRGHKRKMGRNQFLIMASEFVSVKTGKHHDEHLAELIQAVSPQSGFDDEKCISKKDISGDSIRKKREHLKEIYPHMYAVRISWVRSLPAVRDHRPEPLRRR